MRHQATGHSESENPDACCPSPVAYLITTFPTYLRTPDFISTK